MERELFLQNLIGQSKIDSIKNGIQPSQGGLVEPNQGAPMEDFIQRQFGDFGVKILGVSDGAENLAPQDITVIGGWCAIRTADMLQLQQGVITTPTLGIAIEYRSVDQVADWIKQAISIDQIVEAIGIYNGTNYAAISEEKLWGDRVKSAVESSLRRRLNLVETGQLEVAMEIAELARFKFTKRYIEYIQGGTISLSRVVDRDIYTGLVAVRDEMLKTARVSLGGLLDRYPQERTTAGYSIVWGMYTGPYLALLQERGYVSTPKGLIVEPWMHAISETRSRRMVNQNIFERGKNPYLAQSSANQNLGFVAYADVMLGMGERVRQTIPISGVPNQQNYKEFIGNLNANGESANPSLADNPVFVWGVNLLPFGNTKDALYKMITIKDAYKASRKNLGNLPKEEASRKADQLRNDYSTFMAQQSEFVINELRKLLQYVFEKKRE